MQPPLTRLSDVLETAHLDGDSGAAALPEDWGQGRTLFGGLSSAVLLQALRRAEPGYPPLRTALVQFVAPVNPGPVELRRRHLRAGMSLIQEQLELWQQGTPRVLVTASYGVARRSTLAASGPDAPILPPPGELTPLPDQPGITPVFMRHLDFRFGIGSPPVTGASELCLGGWFRLRDPGDVHPDPLLAVLVDAWPPPALVGLRRPRPASTISWALHLTPAAAAARATDWYRFRAEAPQAAEGFAPVQAGLWNVDGTTLALASQMDVVFG